MKRQALTLIEVILVLCIISTLLTLLIPAVLSARKAARLSACQSNIRQIALQVIDSIHVSNRLPENRITFEHDVAKTESIWRSVSVAPAGMASQLAKQNDVWNCPSAPAALLFEGLPRMFNGDDTNIHSKTIDYVGCGGVSSIESPFSNLPPLAKRRGIFAELIGHQSHRNSASLMNGYSNSIMMWESAGALHYRAGERRKRGLEWQPYLANNNFVLSGDAEPITQVISRNFGTKAKYLLCADGYATGKVGIFLRPDLLWTEPIGLEPVSSSVINVSNVGRAPFSLHDNKCNFVFADGATKVLNEDAEPSIIFRMSQLNP